MTDIEEANVKVVCRFRPFNNREKGLGLEGSQNLFRLEDECVEVVDRTDKDNKPLVFRVTRVFNMDSIQEDVYEVVAARAMSDLFTGYNASIFAYGQTGSGKSWTMFGDRKNLHNRGLVPRCTESIFKTIVSTSKGSGGEFTIGCSYCEIYQEKITDLFRPANNDLKLREDKKGGVYVAGLSTEYVSNVADVYQLLAIGDASKKKASTLMNQDSSRSHCCFTIRLQSHDKDGNMSEALLNLIDLAGSEKVAKTGAKGQSFEEAKKINLSLTTLAKVIKALSEGSGGRVPYRESTLTRLLQNSLGGNSKTSMIVAASPHLDNIEETISSLRFAQSCAMVRNRVRQNLVLNPEQLQAMLEAAQNEIRRAAGRGEVAEMKDFSSQTQEGEDEETWEFDDSGKASASQEEVQALLQQKDFEIEQERLQRETLQVKLDSKELELQSAVGQVEYLTGRITDLERATERLKDVEGELAGRQRECDTLNSRLLRLQSEVSDQRKEIAKLESDLGQHNMQDERKESRRASALELAQSIARSRSQSMLPPPVSIPEGGPKRKASSIARIGLSFASKGDRKQDKIQQLTEENEALEESVIALDSEIARLKMEVQSLHTTVADKEQLLKMSEAAKDGLEKRAEQHDKMLALVERSKEDVEKRLNEQFAIVARLKEGENSVKTLEAECKEAREREVELEQQLGELEARLVEANKRKASANIRVPVVADSVLEPNRASEALNSVLGIFSFGFGGGEEKKPETERPKSAAFSLNPMNLFSVREADEEALEPVAKARPTSMKLW